MQKLKMKPEQPWQTWFFRCREVRRTECCDRNLCWTWYVVLLWRCPLSALPEMATNIFATLSRLQTSKLWAH